VEQHKQEVSTRTCNVCGNTLEKYQRLCDRCGSIQRPIKARGVRVEREVEEKPGSCERCGVSIPAKKSLCDPCAAAAQAAIVQKKSSRSGFPAMVRRLLGALKRFVAYISGRDRQ